MVPNLSLQEVEKVIEHFEPEEQKQLLSDLPHLLKISDVDLALLKVSEQSFEFWNNPEDEIYNDL